MMGIGLMQEKIRDVPAWQRFLLESGHMFIAKDYVKPYSARKSKI